MPVAVERHVAASQLASIPYTPRVPNRVDNRTAALAAIVLSASSSAGCGRTDLPDACPTRVHAEASESWAVSLPAWRGGSYPPVLADAPEGGVVVATRLREDLRPPRASPRCDAPPPGSGVDVVAFDRFGEVRWRVWLASDHLPLLWMGSDARGAVYVAEARSGVTGELRLTRLDDRGRVVDVRRIAGGLESSGTTLSVAADGRLLFAVNDPRLELEELDALDEGARRAAVLTFSPSLELLEVQPIPDTEASGCLRGARWTADGDRVVSFVTPCSEFAKGANEGYLTRLSPQGQARWSHPLDPIYADVLDAPNDIVVYDGEALHRIDGASGETVWSTWLENVGIAQGRLAGPHLYAVGTAGGGEPSGTAAFDAGVLVVDADDGERLDLWTSGHTGVDLGHGLVVQPNAIVHGGLVDSVVPEAYFGMRVEPTFDEAPPGGSVVVRRPF